MPYNASLDSIIANGVIGKAYRVLTTDLQWPVDGDGNPLDPPFPPGTDGTVPMVTVTAIPDSPAAYASDTFIATDWTDVTALVSSYHYTQDANMPIDQLSLAVPTGWAANDLGLVFREMRVILVQERFTDGTDATDWLNLCWCISDGFAESWTEMHQYTVEAKNVLKLAHLDHLAALEGQIVFQGDTIVYGTQSAPLQMTYLGTDGEVYEFGIITEDGSPLAVYGNWADMPSPQFWALNVPNFPPHRSSLGVITSSGTWPQPVPLAVAGNAMNAIFGDGILRIGVSYCQTPPTGMSPGDADYYDPTKNPPNFSVGLGLAVGAQPTIGCMLSRYALPQGFQDYQGRALPADIRGSTTDGSQTLTVRACTGGLLTVENSNHDIHQVLNLHHGLTVIVHDGSGRQLATTTITPETNYWFYQIQLADITQVIAAGTVITYGNANRVSDVVEQILLRAGYQTRDATQPLYLHAPPNPVLPSDLAQGEIVLPPIVITDDDDYTPLAFLEKLRQEGLIPPNYLPVADAAGQISLQSVQQVFTGDTLIPITAMPVTPGLTHDRTDVNVFTRVVVKGKHLVEVNLCEPGVPYELSGMQFLHAGDFNALHVDDGLAVPNPLSSDGYEAIATRFSGHTSYGQVYLPSLLAPSNGADITQVRPWRATAAAAIGSR